MTTTLWAEVLPIPQGDHTVSQVSIVITRERSRKPKISELQVTLVVYQKVRTWTGSIKHNILA